VRNLKKKVDERKNEEKMEDALIKAAFLSCDW